MAKPVILFNNSELQKTAFMFACKGSFSKKSKPQGMSLTGKKPNGRGNTD